MGNPLALPGSNRPGRRKQQYKETHDPFFGSDDRAEERDWRMLVSVKKKTAHRPLRTQDGFPEHGAVRFLGHSSAGPILDCDLRESTPLSLRSPETSCRMAGAG